MSLVLFSSFVLNVLLEAGLLAQLNNPCPTSCATSANFSVDSFGPVDTRPSTWGHADATIFPVQFKPPAGFRVRILSINGDLVSWPKVMPGESPVKAGSYAGVLASFFTSAPDSSTKCELCADNHLLYVQDALTDKPVRTTYKQDTEANGLLEADNKLNVKVAQWLNTTGYPIHMEPTFTVTFRYETEQ